MKELIEKRAGKYPADSITKKIYDAEVLIGQAMTELSDLDETVVAPGALNRILGDLQGSKDSLERSSKRIGRFVKGAK